MNDHLSIALAIIIGAALLVALGGKSIDDDSLIAIMWSQMND